MVEPAGSEARTILVAEDDEAARTLLTRYLQGKGYTVRAVEDGQYALDELGTSTDIDLVILDNMMPRLSGFDVLERVRARGDTTPIIMATAAASAPDIVKALSLGADDYVTKPYLFPVLLARVELRMRPRPTVDAVKTTAAAAPASAAPGAETPASQRTPDPAPRAPVAETKDAKPHKLVDKLGAIIRSRLASNTLDIPSPPAAATNCLRLMQNSEVPGKSLVDALKVDPVLTAQLMRVANAARFGTLRVTSLEQAIARLGHKQLKAMVLEASTRTLFTSRDERIGATVRLMFTHSLAVATLGRDIALLAGSKDAETAYLAGLLHDVGKMVIGGFLLEAERKLGGTNKGWLGQQQWLAIVQDGHRPVGVALAMKWGFPEAVVTTVRDCGEYDNGNRSAPRNFVCFANAIAKTHGIYESITDPLDNAACVMLAQSVLGLDEEVITRFANSLPTAVTDLLQE
jgi:putative nucleotidyltransferase with HDIG domain